MKPEKRVPAVRIRRANDAPVNDRGDYVLYWMIANRRAEWNFALDRAVERANELNRPVLVLEALRVGYRWACDRFHNFILDALDEHRGVFEKKNVSYYPYVEPSPGEGRGLIERLGRRACIVITDEFPCFFLPAMVEKAGDMLPVMLEVVDSAGLLPMRDSPRAFPTAYSFRRFLQKRLPERLQERPGKDPFSSYRVVGRADIPDEITTRWPPAGIVLDRTGGVSGLPIDHNTGPGYCRGGAEAARDRLGQFLAGPLATYHERGRDAEQDLTSGLSPYLHFGHISSHEVFHSVSRSQGWSLDRLSTSASGGRSRWWGMSPGAEAFLDQLVTWRELGFNMCMLGSGWDSYESLPDWALSTLKAHEEDPRPHLYRPEDFEAAETHDELWNVIQRQLLTEGRIHNYLRMLWGKKILEWSRSPRTALEVMLELNNKYSLDGRDPNSYSGVFWVLGRYDRAWGPERPVFGKIRYMSSKNTARKLRVEKYISKYQP
ncbi:MAG TPA: deoxyribodipyrimidine photolyase [Desulfobacteraceae bacterium]|nr:deoxyribodipyrimidine photolyase [Desulfobacteraceae bacterium]